MSPDGEKKVVCSWSFGTEREEEDEGWKEDIEYVKRDKKKKAVAR